MLTVEHLLDEERGAGELVHDARLNRSLTLHPQPGARPGDVRFGDDADPVQVRIWRGPQGTEVHLNGAVDEIGAPEGCSGHPPTTRLGTSLLLDDGAHTPLRLVVEPRWRCLGGRQLVL